MREVVLNRPFVLGRGYSGVVDTNRTSAYFGDWVSFLFPIDEDSTAELRIPLDEALEYGLVIEPKDKED